jgi:hypothetical protein
MSDSDGPEEEDEGVPSGSMRRSPAKRSAGAQQWSQAAGRQAVSNSSGGDSSSSDVLDLTEVSPAAAPHHQQRRRQRQQRRQAAPAAAAPEPAVPTLAERLAAANAGHGLDLVIPPAHWKVTDALLAGRLQLVELPLPSSGAASALHVDVEVSWESLLLQLERCTFFSCLPCMF